MQGWIKLHRKILTSDIFQNEKLLKVFIYCLTKATHSNYEQKVGRQKIPLKPGQFISGRRKAALELDMNESTVRDYLKLLKDDNIIDIKSTNKYSVITIVNWDVYQSTEEIPDNKDDIKIDSRKPAEGQQKDTNKNIKNLREEEEEEEDRENAFTFYQQNFGMPSPYIAQSIGMWIDDTSEEIVIEAMKEGLRNNARTFKYCESILKDWYSKNIRRLSDLKVQQQYTRNPKVTPINKKQDNLAQLDAIFKKMGLKEEVQ